MVDLKRGELDEQAKQNSIQNATVQQKFKADQESLKASNDQKKVNSGIQQEKWQALKQRQALNYQFDLMLKYNKLKTKGFDNHQILVMIPDMRPIIDKTNMPSHVQLSTPYEGSQVL